MTKEDFARELILGELEKEKGRFVTQRIIDRLVLLYSPLFEREYLTVIAERINSSDRFLKLDKTGRLSGKSKDDPDKSEEEGDEGRKLASVVNQ